MQIWNLGVSIWFIHPIFKFPDQFFFSFWIEMSGLGVNVITTHGRLAKGLGVQLAITLF